MSDEHHPDTLAIHAGQDPEPIYGAVNVPIYQTSTFAQEGVGRPRRWDYARAGNPTRAAFETALAALEGGSWCRAFASGLAAEHTLLLTLRPGDHVLLGTDVYGGTYRLLARVFEPWGLTHSACDLTDLDAVRAAVRDETRLVWIETPSNPMLEIVDVAGVAAIAHEAGALAVVDNTFATPALQRPLALGADVVVHSVTKYLGGHSDLIGGAIVTNDEDLGERLAFLVNAVGAIPGPTDSYLALRGLKTLGVRMRRHSENAERIARFLASHPSVPEVRYPGLATHPGHEVAARQMRGGFGGMVSFRAGSRDRAIRIAEGTELFWLAESLGGVESLIEVPGAMTHASVAGSPLEVPADLVRLSVGLEDPRDLEADLARVLEG
ncbi:MAG: cystathionine gamma-synthase [Actinomycetota bacterium]|jgi:cystathionine gamma-synthase|nr:MAG: cystathionine gamma-synthase [Actinomycetota bacterium]